MYSYIHSVAFKSFEKKNTFSHKAVSINDDLNLHDTVYSPLVGERGHSQSTDSRQDHHPVSWAPSWQGLASEVLRSGGIKRSKRERGEGTSLAAEPHTTGAWTQSLARELRPGMPGCEAKELKKRKRRRRSGRTAHLPAESLCPRVAACSSAFFPETKLRGLSAPRVSLRLTQRHRSGEEFPQAVPTASRTPANNMQTEEGRGGWEEKPMRPLAFSKEGSS